MPAPPSPEADARPDASAELFRCGRAARWLPRSLAGALLVAALLAGARLAEAPQPAIGRTRYFVILVGAAAALWIVKQGGELRVSVRVDDDSLHFEAAGVTRRLAWDEIESIGFAPPFARSRSWLPATLLVDRAGRLWRLSALLRDGDRLIERSLRRSGRHDLATWAEALALPRRMGRAAALVLIGYLLSGAILAAAAVFYLR